MLAVQALSWAKLVDFRFEEVSCRAEQEEGNELVALFPCFERCGEKELPAVRGLTDVLGVVDRD
ncbi:hypothetical protein LWC34_28135 [Kibdelosporangium philippinense]|uniref:Uncharacterized protein n=1 Tax=Kibdelosporangium philippinense TaxID=211113 RepID=A0ABS8ZH53_9PSEU|nr:hypothetical protein [Kibdelosporangium philippinense]MCE7006669.1 hypothetical protein [Kibdelosporangium philippinense]